MKSDCKIAAMLKKQRRHISFHTPGHKRSGGDITELSYSDNLYSPHGVLAEAERDIALILGAAKSFLLTDGSTAGVFSMFAALRAAGVKKVAAPVYSHVSVGHAAFALGLELVPLSCGKKAGIPLQPTIEEIETGLKKADALLLTSPDYYGNFPPLLKASELARAAGKPFLIDGAHGSHLHFTNLHAGKYGDMWVDGVHKSLPALTQGAVVSANGAWAEGLLEGVRLFRTTSPSYPVMASVEYAVKYPRNLKIEEAATVLKRELHAVENDDWTKILLPFGSECDGAQRYLEAHGVYPEFNDGNYLMFYLSPATGKGELKKLKRLVSRLPRGELAPDPVPGTGIGEPVYLALGEAVGKICAVECGLFPPCLPLLRVGDVVTKEAAERLKRGNAYGTIDGKIAVMKSEK